MLYFTFSQIQEQLILIGQNGLIHVLVWMVVLDIATGLVKSFKEKRTNSTTGLFGVIKHLLVVMLTFLVAIYVPLFGYEGVAKMFVIYLIVVYAISITENWVMLGLPMPLFIIEKLEKLKDTMDKGEKVTIDSQITTIEIKKPGEDDV